MDVSFGPMSGSLRTSLFFRYAQFLTFWGLRARAIEFLYLVVRADPRHQRAWTFLGFLHAQDERFDDAVKAFEAALALNPADADSTFNLGYVLQKARRHDAAIERFQKTIELNRFLDRAWYGLGLSLVQQGRYAEAAEKLREATRLQPMNPYAGYQLGAALFKLGEHEAVRAEYERIRGFDPKISEQMRVDFGVSAER
jgi:tetratricopeptide (TPR) repeat protein